ncbi:hypothetical protein PPYR_12152 [Photinus pyralis]|uniref:Uncharacterized protein n=2 Tax=Photinus pyralis TaxID=7054 RepID=A0A5N4ADA6_PHOPY|nr:ABC transporter G family member 20-like [Photinus pyralis]KAB0795313.1 hypothetical protein PPYR_12152 [Photinus pyralis]
MEGDSSELELRRRELQSQLSNVNIRKQNAICVRRAYKRYGTKKNPFVILDGLNMTVPKGTIYGLLGASGCGKTTLLSCIVGRKRLNAGEIWVLGGTPGSRGSGVPGPRIGYMPQEIALYGGFSIKETLTYFGWIAGMTDAQIQNRLEFLVKFLMLPDAECMVKNLSGGQQRRVSLASALLHEPELLILDEPTVGVDPLLRQSIWDHLVEITRTGHTTVIITTHYIDETRQAHLIGLMRGGYFLAEESPAKLLRQFEADTLEDVFLKLSVIQNMGRQRRSSIAQAVSSVVGVPNGVVNEAVIVDSAGENNEISGEFGDNISLSARSTSRLSLAISEDPGDLSMSVVPPEDTPPAKISDYFVVLKSNHMKALVWKNFLGMLRNVAMMLFITLLPVAQIVLFCASIGHDPVSLPIAVINHESENNCSTPLHCNSTRLSCHYLNYLAKKDLVLHYYTSEQDAKESVRKGGMYASIAIKHNYSLALQARMVDLKNSHPWDVQSSEIDVYRDVSSKTIAEFIKAYLYDTFQEFAQDYLEACGYDRHLLQYPIRMEKPIYGLSSPNFTDFATPGIILTVIFFLAVALTSGAMLIERNEGSLERSLVIGIGGVELLTAHVICQFVIMVIQSIMVMVVAFALFNMTVTGSLVLVTILTFMTGFCGMCYGFVVSCLCSDERAATYVAMGSFLPTVMLCGIIWPSEAMHYLLRTFAIFLPLTKATESMRNILQRGWDFYEPAVYVGFISIGTWIVIFLTISVLFLKFNKG